VFKSTGSRVVGAGARVEANVLGRAGAIALFIKPKAKGEGGPGRGAGSSVGRGMHVVGPAKRWPGKLGQACQKNCRNADVGSATALRTEKVRDRRGLNKTTPGAGSCLPGSPRGDSRGAVMKKVHRGNKEGKKGWPNCQLGDRHPEIDLRQVGRWENKKNGHHNQQLKKNNARRERKKPKSQRPRNKKATPTPIREGQPIHRCTGGGTAFCE